MFSTALFKDLQLASIPASQNLILNPNPIEIMEPIIHKQPLDNFEKPQHCLDLYNSQTWAIYSTSPWRDLWNAQIIIKYISTLPRTSSTYSTLPSAIITSVPLTPPGKQVLVYIQKSWIRSQDLLFLHTLEIHRRTRLLSQLKHGISCSLIWELIHWWPHINSKKVPRIRW